MCQNERADAGGLVLERAREAFGWSLFDLEERPFEDTTLANLLEDLGGLGRLSVDNETGGVESPLCRKKMVTS